MKTKATKIKKRQSIGELTSLTSEATCSAPKGVCSAGFKIMVQPQANAGASFHTIIDTG